MSATALLDLTADIVSAHVANNSIAFGDLPVLIGSIHATLAGLGVTAAPPAAARQEPAVAVRNSVKPDYIICLEDGKKLKMLKRHLMTRYQLTPDQYRAKWSLPADYPMVSANYSAAQYNRKEVGPGPQAGKNGAEGITRDSQKGRITAPKTIHRCGTLTPVGRQDAESQSSYLASIAVSQISWQRASKVCVDCFEMANALENRRRTHLTG